MRTDELIALLAAETRPAASAGVRRRLALACLIGAAGAALLVFAVLGPWRDFAHAMHTSPFWMKAAYTLWLALAGYALAERTARPGMRTGQGLWWIAIAAFAAIAALALASLGRTAPDHWRAAWMGSSARICPFAIIGCAVPVFAAVILAMRSLA
ncbi:MAG: DUF1109 domain-containing protein, partial [Caulobacteraceae bacterium]|nr:DUF1109 domain-containing protein [Caulobacteraceae bacterium]